MNARRFFAHLVAPGLALALLGSGGCDATPAEPLNPTWADVAPIFRGECNGCHGWNAGQTGGGYRFDFFEATKDVCGDAALALGPGVVLAGSPLVAPLIVEDVIPWSGAAWARMPPQPSPALPHWERDTIERWAVGPVKGPPPPDNRPPTIAVTRYPATADRQLTFTAVVDDPDGDSVLGVVEANGLAFLMSRPGSFAVSFDSSTWPPGPQSVTAVLCDGWTKASVPLGTVAVSH
jgi:hypothetical protein